MTRLTYEQCIKSILDSDGCMQWIFGSCLFKSKTGLSEGTDAEIRLASPESAERVVFGHDELSERETDSVGSGTARKESRGVSRNMEEAGEMGLRYGWSRASNAERRYTGLNCNRPKTRDPAVGSSSLCVNRPRDKCSHPVENLVCSALNSQVACLE